MSKGSSKESIETSTRLQAPKNDTQLYATYNEQQNPAPQHALRIAHAMQTSLDAYYLIKRFADELKALVPYSSFSYSHDESDHHYHEGKIQPHVIHYSLKIEEEHFGHIELSRSEKFSEREIEAFTNAMSLLVYPLRNSIKYHKAVIHSLTDPLTRLGNRLAYNNTMLRELEFASRHDSPLALIVCDIDKFKSINDTYGHCAGDRVIADLGQVLREVCRNSDIVFRIGGEEFVIVLSHTDLEGAQTLANRVLRDIRIHNFHWQEQSITVTLSLGISCYQHQDTTTTLFQRADQALYLSKKAGGDQVKTL